MNKRALFEGQEVAAAIDLGVIGNRFVSIDPSSFLKRPENCSVQAGTIGVVQRVEDTRLLIKFRPGSNMMVALWFERASLATLVKIFDRVYQGP